MGYFTSISAVSQRLSKIDLLARGLSRTDLESFLSAEPSSGRYVISSVYLNFIQRLEEIHGIDLKVELREKISDLLYGELIGHVEGLREFADEMSVIERIKVALDSVPNGSSTAFTDVVRYTLGSRISIKCIAEGGWADEDVLAKIASLTLTNKEWISDGGGAISPLIVRHGVYWDVISTSANIVMSDLYLLRLPERSMEVVAIKRDVTKTDYGNISSIRCVAKLVNDVDLKELVEFSTQNHVRVYWGTLAADEYQQYLMGTLPLGKAIRAKALRPFKVGDSL